MGNENNDGFGPTLLSRCDPFYLGMNRQMADPCFDVKGTTWQALLEKESDLPAPTVEGVINEPEGIGAKAHFKMSERLHFGVTAMPPGISANFHPYAVASGLGNCVQMAVDLWVDLTLVVFEHEVVIQDYIKGLSQQQLQEHLNEAWREAKSTFNILKSQEMDRVDEHLREQLIPANHPTGSKYELDAADMPDFHAPDLDNFAMDFMEDVLDSTKANFVPPNDDILVPFYRTGCNYSDRLLKVNIPAYLRNSGYEGVARESTRHGIPFNLNSKHFDAVRSAYLAPHINLQDLMVPENLLRFIHYRARLEPRNFAAHDNIMTYTGRHSKIISGPLHGNRMFAMLERDKGYTEWFKGYGAEPAPKSAKSEGHHGYYRSGQLFGSSEYYLLLKSQTLTYAFLKSLCMGIAEKLDLRPKVTIAAELDPSKKAKARFKAVEKIARENLECKTPWPDRATLAQYEPRAPGIKVEQFVTRIESQFKEAEEHISKLFDHPDYFTEMMIQEREHHWHNIPESETFRTDQHVNDETLRIDEYVNKEERHGLYRECLRRVSKRALFEIFLWNTTKVTLEAFNQTFLNKHQNSDQVPERLDDFPIWPKPPSMYSRKKPQEVGPLLRKYMELVALVRYNAIFFLNEFRVAAIHASSEPFRQDFVRKGKRKDVDINKGHFGSKPTHLTRRSRAYNKDEDDKDLLIDLIDTFIADEGASMHIGIHRVTERLQFLLDDPGDTTWKYVTKHVAKTIGKLHLLAELADHLERWTPVAEKLGALPEEKRKDYFRKATQGMSIDFFEFDGFKIDDGGFCIPRKRINRLCSFLDEVQQFQSGVNRTTGIARGDLKRYACSLLKQYIVPTDERSSHKAGEDVYKRLEVQMGVTRDSYPFTADEEPVDIGPGNSVYKVGGLSFPNKQTDREGKYKNEARDWKSRAKGKGKRTASEAVGLVFERNREEIVARRRVKMQARLQRLRDKWDRENAAHRARMAAIAAQPRPRPRPQPQPQVQPRPAAPPTIPLAPDGNPKRLLKRPDWDNLAGLFRVDQATPPSFHGIKLTLSHLGYDHKPGQGSHCTFERTDGCRWAKKDLPKGDSWTWSEPHGGKRERASAAKTATWARLVREQGFTWEFVNDWHYGYE